MGWYAVCSMWYAVCGFLPLTRRASTAAKRSYHLPPTTYHLPPTAYRLPPTAHRPPPTAHHLPRKGVSLMEVLISTFVIAIGLLGLAALIPVGRYTLVEAGKADRAGACGRAALRDVKVRGMLENYSYWLPLIPDATTNIVPFAIDPLGHHAGLLALGPITRRNLSYITTPAQAQSIFNWHDDLVFHMPDDRTLRPTQLPTGSEYEGSYSWFITVVPAANENGVTGVPLRNKTLYTVSVVVCYKRDLSTTGEHTATVNQFYGGGYGGGSVMLTFAGPAGDINVREGQWIMLYGIDAASGRTQCSWYRLVTVGEVDPNFPNDRYLSLAGPDWTVDTDGNGNLDAEAVIIDGVIGVYTTTIEID